MTGRGGHGGGFRGGARGALYSGSGAPVVDMGTRTAGKISTLVESTPQQETPAKHSE